MKACVLKNKDLVNIDIKPLDTAVLGPNDVLIKHVAFSINFDDILYANGTYPLGDEAKSKENIILGFDGTGIVQRKGLDVKGFEIGSKVAYAFAPIGSYVEYRVIDYRYLVSVPDEMDLTAVAAVFRRGLAAEYLLFRTYRPRKQSWILIHSVTGGLGHILARWANFNEINVIGTVGSEEKVSTAYAAGCKGVINRSKDNMLEKVKEFTDGKYVSAVFDGIGKSVFEDSIKCLQTLGVYISLGYTSGVIESIPIGYIRNKSIFFTAPRLQDYKANRKELILSSVAVLNALQNGIITPQITRYGFDGIKHAHKELASGKTTGCLVVSV